MVWCVANERRTKYLGFDENDEPKITTKFVESAAFDSVNEAIEWSVKLKEKFDMSPLEPKFDDMLSPMLR